MLSLRSRVAAFGLLFLCASAAAPQNTKDGLELGRKMLVEDNPCELWLERGKRLFHERRGPKKASLEQCDFGLGPGQLDGAAAQLPRYFSDTDRVQDLESRLVTCMVEHQGFSRADLAKTAITHLVAYLIDPASPLNRKN